MSNSSNRLPPKVRKIAVLGSRAVGKSSMIVQFVEGQFQENYYPTIENNFQKLLRYRNQDYQLEIIDTAGQDEYSLLHSKHAIGIHGYVLTYSITSSSSLEMLRVIRDKILNYTGLEWVPMVIVGNKMDLEQQRQVTLEDAQRLAQQWNAVCIEASAKLNQNVQRIFELAVHEIEKSNGAEGSFMVDPHSSSASSYPHLPFSSTSSSHPSLHDPKNPHSSTRKSTDPKNNQQDCILL